jgi:hypothetical protein
MVAAEEVGCSRAGCRSEARKARILCGMHLNTHQHGHRLGGVLKKLLVALVILVVVVVIAVVLMIDSIARVGIEAAGTYALGTKTSVREASIGLVSGKTAIRGLAVSNPTGYSPTKFVSLDEIAVDAGLSSFTGEKIVIERVALSGLVIEIEKDASGALNVQKFADHLKQATGGGSGASGEPKPAPTGESKEAVIRELRLEKMQVNLRNIAGGKDGLVEVKLPDLVIRDLSSKGGVDVLASELSGVVIGSAIKGVLAANIEGLGSEVLGGLQGAVEGIGGAITGPLRDAVDKGVTEAGAALKAVGEGITKGLGEAAGKVLDGAGKALEGAGKSIGEGVGNALDGVFGGGKKK